MKVSFYHIVIVILLSAASVHAQQADDIILKAMQDELDTNMKELRLPNYDKPFFIMYSIQDQRSYSLTATLGSIIESTERPSRFKSNTRILVGDYSFNDESLEDNLTSPPTALDIGLPIDDDYAGIRRSLWSSTDKVYRDAARHFLKHQQTLKESGKQLSEIPHRSFAKGSPVRLISTYAKFAFDKTTYESLLKDLSAVFLKHPDIIYSSIIFQFTEGHNYMVNSEGVVAKIPFQETSLVVIGQHKNQQGEIVLDQVVHNVQTPDQLPSPEDLKSEIKSMITRIEKQLDVAKLDEEYTGPVLLSGPVVGNIFASVLFGRGESIYANNFIPRLSGYQFSNNAAAMDNKIGKNILSESITVKARPKLKTYDGKPLLASFDIDDEGIVPPDEVVVVQNGVLKNLLNDRTLTQSTQNANGFSSGPGVIEVTSNHRNSEKELKEKLIAAARADGLDFGLMVKHGPNLMGITNVYKVNVKDGSEVLLRNALLQEVSFKVFRRILGASETYLAHNVGASNYLLNARNNGQKASYIVPESILLESMEVKPFDMPTLKEDDYVSNPLVKSDK